MLQFREIRHWTSLRDGELLGVNKAKLQSTGNLMPKDENGVKRSTMSLPSKRRVLYHCRTMKNSPLGKKDLEFFILISCKYTVSLQINKKIMAML